MGKVTTATSSGTCSSTFLGRKAILEFVLPSKLRRWADALTYTILVDGSQVWRPDSSMCEPVAPGLNSLGRGKELLFSYCAKDPQIVWGSDDPTSVLSRGRHDVEVIASLPGTKVRFSARGNVDLACSP